MSARGRVKAVAAGLRGLSVDVVAAVVLAAGLSFGSLFGGPGVESAIVLGVVLPIVIAARTARDVARARHEEGFVDASSLLGDALFRSALPVAIAATLLLARAYAAKPCEPFAGLAFLAVGPLAGSMLAALFGVSVGGLSRSTRRATVVGALVPIAGLLVGLAEFFATPAIFVFALFAGYFPGTIYDENVGISDALLTYRALSFVLAAAIALFVHAMWNGRRLVPSRLRLAPRRATLGALLFATYAVATVRGADFGHRASRAAIEAELGGRVDTARCTLYVPREMPLASRRLHGADCDFHVTTLEAFLGVRHPSRVRVYVYRSVDEKRALMGAAETDIAKPWRDEVHVEDEPWPHGVLRHELAHVLAASLSGTPVGYAATFGAIPNPGVIEGLAVAAAWDVRDGLTPDEWSRAMFELDALPPTRDLVSLGFARLPSNRAYSGAGSLLRFLVRTEGRGALAKLYRRGRFANDAELSELAARWRRFLRTVPLSDEARALVRQRLERKSLFSAVCPHVVARLESELSSDVAAGDTRAAVATCDRVLAIDPSDRRMVALRISSLARGDDIRGAERSLTELVHDPNVATPTLVAAKMAIADAYARRGDVEHAGATYDALLSSPLSDDAARQLEARREATRAPGPERALLVDLLLGHDRRATESSVAAHLSTRLGAIRADGLGPYLAGRQLHASGRHDLAAPSLDEALRRGLPTARFAREATRLSALSHEALGHFDLADALFARLVSAPFVHAEAELHRERIAYVRAR